MSETKTIIFWIKKGCRKPKQLGLATAVCSVNTIDDMSKAAREGRGKLFIVEAATADAGRKTIAAFRAGESTGAGVVSVIEGPDRIVAIGLKACAAIAGASSGKRNWDARLARQGRVTENQSRALDNNNPMAHWNLDNVFGRGLGGDE
jgi:hypothetical protein